MIPHDPSAISSWRLLSMTLRLPFAAALLLLAFAAFGFALTGDAHAHTLPAAGIEGDIASGVAPEQIESPAPSGDDTQTWVWLAIGAFVVFTALGFLLAVFGYMESTRRD
jgi:hypothetical protein